MAGLLALVDVAARTAAHDRPALFSLHYSGRTRALLLFAPEIAALRSRVLDYFKQPLRRGAVGAGHVIFDFSAAGLTVGRAEQELVSQLMLASEGKYPSHHEKSDLLSGEDPRLADLCPELPVLRDTALLFRMPQEAPDRLSVTGFCKCLDACYKEPSEETSWTEKLPSWLGGGRKQITWRNWSAANPSALAGSEIEDEVDVLHLKDVPNFEKTLKQPDSELLLSILTAPYLRIPLLLGFFADRDR
eukprot:gene18206-40023_t